MRKTNAPFYLDVVSVRLVHDAPVFSKKPIKSPEDAVEVMGKYLCEMDREVFCLINLKSNGIPINCHFASVGSVDSTVVHPRELFKASILSNAAAMICMHNHPSGNLEPSMADIRMTDRLVQVCELMQIPLYDHIIVGGDNSKFFSFREKDILPYPSVSLQSDYEQINFPPLEVAEKGR